MSQNQSQSAKTGSAGNVMKEFSESEWNRYVKDVVHWFDIFLGLHMSDADMLVWFDKLKEYPHWKLKEISNYSLDDRGYGRTLSHVCKYLDDLRPRPERETVREDIGYKCLEHNPRKEIARRTLEHCKAMMSHDESPAQLDVRERAWLDGMRRDFSSVNWQGGRKANLAY